MVEVSASVQAYEGVVIAKRNRGLNSGFTVRKISSGEKAWSVRSDLLSLIAKIEVKRRGDVRRAKLYYLRERSGKSARIAVRCPSVLTRLQQQLSPSKPRVGSDSVKAATVRCSGFIF